MRVAKQPERTPITDAQEMLRLIYDLQPLAFDGRFDEETEKAVRRLQRDNGLPESGTLDAQTHAVLRSVYRDNRIRKAQAHPLQLVLQPDQVLRRDEENVHLFVMQAVLLALGEFYVQLPAVEVNGRLDAPTQEAVVWFQEKAGLPMSGEIDRRTWMHLAHEYRQVAGDGTGSFPVRITQESTES